MHTLSLSLSKNHTTRPHTLRSITPHPHPPTHTHTHTHSHPLTPHTRICTKLRHFSLVKLTASFVRTVTEAVCLRRCLHRSYDALFQSSREGIEKLLFLSLARLVEK